MIKHKLMVCLFVLMAIVGIMIGWMLWIKREPISIQEGTLVKALEEQGVSL